MNTATPRKKPITPPSVIEPPAWELADASAIQALARGDANKEQQQRALNWIINSACDTYGLDYRTDARDHAFGSGRRFVGMQVVKLLKINIGALRKKGDET